jgi:hypothetical protein
MRCVRPADGRLRIDWSWSVMKSNKFKLVSAAVGATAVVAMGTLTAGVSYAAPGPVAPQHYGGPVNTSIYAPTASLGMPMTSASSPSPDGVAAASGTAGTSQGVT